MLLFHCANELPRRGIIGFAFLLERQNNPENPGLLLSSKIILIGKPCGLAHGFRQSLKLM